MVIIFIWAFLEAIVFFIIPDVALTYYAIKQKVNLNYYVQI